MRKIIFFVVLFFLLSCNQKAEYTPTTQLKFESLRAYPFEKLEPINWYMIVQSVSNESKGLLYINTTIKEYEQPFEIKAPQLAVIVQMLKNEVVGFNPETKDLIVMKDSSIIQKALKPF